jgi:hypothetical protein
MAGGRDQPPAAVKSAQSLSLPITSSQPPENVLDGLCVWEEWEGGASGPRRCSELAMPGRPWCLCHWQRHQTGKSLLGRRAR